MDRIASAVTNGEVKSQSPPAVPPLLPFAPRLTLVFWMVLGSVAGVNLAQGAWRVAGLGTGAFAIAVPIGAVAGAVGGVLVGRITRPRLLVLVMALLAGWSVGGLGGGFAWGEIGQMAGGLAGALVGGLTWAVWVFRGCGKEIP